MAFEKYPWHQVLMTNMSSISTYALGIVIIQYINWFVAGLYIAYILILEFRLLKFHCPDCYYYGKICAFGKGKLSSMLFKKGIPDRFICKSFSWKDLFPDLLVFVFPALAAIILMIFNFKWIILGFFIVLIIMNTAGNAYVRGQIACKHCKQKDLGCPATNFFSQAKS